MSRLQRLFLATLLLAVADIPLALGEAPVRQFHADMSGEWETKLTHSKATGSADVSFDKSTLEIHWKVAFTNLSGPPVAVALHGPAQTGANGLTMVDLAPKGKQSPISGSIKLTEAQAQYLLAGWTYVNIETRRWPKGEIRGQVEIVPSAGR